MSQVTAKLMAGAKIDRMVLLDGELIRLNALEGDVLFTRPGTRLHMSGVFVETDHGWHRAIQVKANGSYALLERIPLEDL